MEGRGAKSCESAGGSDAGERCGLHVKQDSDHQKTQWLRPGAPAPAGPSLDSPAMSDSEEPATAEPAVEPRHRSSPGALRRDSNSRPNA